MIAKFSYVPGVNRLIDIFTFRAPGHYGNQAANLHETDLYCSSIVAWIVSLSSESFATEGTKQTTVNFDACEISGMTYYPCG